MTNAIDPITAAREALRRGDLHAGRARDHVVALLAECDRLRRHYDAAGPEHNLLALLDLYHDRESAALAECERLASKLDAHGTALGESAADPHGLGVDTNALRKAWDFTVNGGATTREGVIAMLLEYDRQKGGE
jgi:hypothetical protein